MSTKTTAAQPTPADEQTAPETPQTPDAAAAAPEFTPGTVEEFEARLRAEWPGPHTTSTGEYFVAPEVSEGGWAETLILQAVQVAGELFLGLSPEIVLEPAGDAE